MKFNLERSIFFWEETRSTWVQRFDPIDRGPTDPLDGSWNPHNSRWRFVFTRNKAAGRECNWFARNGTSRGEGDSAPGEFSPLGKRVESFFVRPCVSFVGVVPVVVERRDANGRFRTRVTRVSELHTAERE